MSKHDKQQQQKSTVAAVLNKIPPPKEEAKPVKTEQAQPVLSPADQIMAEEEARKAQEPTTELVWEKVEDEGITSLEEAGEVPLPPIMEATPAEVANHPLLQSLDSAESVWRTEEEPAEAPVQALPSYSSDTAIVEGKLVTKAEWVEDAMTPVPEQPPIQEEIPMTLELKWSTPEPTPVEEPVVEPTEVAKEQIPLQLAAHQEPPRLSQQDYAHCQMALRQMTDASTMFYEFSRRAGCHAFIEFTGLMNEYIVVCREALEQGIDFTMANVHNNIKLPVKAFHLQYMAEKMSCIFAPMLMNDLALTDIFVKGLLSKVMAPTSEG